MKNKFTNAMLILAVGSFLAGSALAQTATQPASTAPATAGPGVVDPGHPRVNEVNSREQNQQNKIANGIKNGSLTPAEASKLEANEAQIQKHEQHLMNQNGGHLTKQEQQRLNRAENRQSRAIYKAKHN